MAIKKISIEQIVKESTIEELFQVNIHSQEWIWVDKDIFLDMIYNVVDYEALEEENMREEINHISENNLKSILDSKFKEIGWMAVEQQLFEKLVEDFISTKDIETLIYVNRRLYAKKIIEKSNALGWILKAMAMDVYQHLGLENKTLVEIYEEYFNGNSRIIEEILSTGQHQLNMATWRFDEKTDLLEFYMTNERYKQWNEGNASFMFSELSK